jgi:hypothetical protein
MKPSDEHGRTAMTDLEKWIDDHATPAETNAFKAAEWMVRADDLRALFAGKMLCDAEPLMWISSKDGEVYATRFQHEADYSEKTYGIPMVPLYAAAKKKEQAK